MEVSSDSYEWIEQLGKDKAGTCGGGAGLLFVRLVHSATDDGREVPNTSDRNEWCKDCRRARPEERCFDEREKGDGL